MSKEDVLGLVVIPLLEGLSRRDTPDVPSIVGLAPEEFDHPCDALAGEAPPRRGTTQGGYGMYPACARLPVANLP